MSNIYLELMKRKFPLRWGVPSQERLVLQLQNPMRFLAKMLIK